MVGILRVGQVGALMFSALLAGCGQAGDASDLSSEQMGGVDSYCNKTLLAALPDPKSVDGIPFSHTDCTYAQAGHTWEKGDLYISVQILDAQAEVPSEIKAMGMGDMLNYANTLTFTMAQASVVAGVEVRAQALADATILNIMCGEAYLPFVTTLSTGNDAVATASQNDGASPLYAVISDRYVLTIERSDSDTISGHQQAERAYKPFIDRLHLEKLGR